MPKKNIAVVYHGNCPDGFSGAWAAWKKFGNKAEYIGATDRVHPPEGLEGKEVYFIDWVYGKDVMLKVKESAKRVVAIDHHETVRDATEAMDDYSYDPKHSGAVLAWKYFHPKKALPVFFKYIEDYDLWKYAFKETKAVNVYLNSVTFDFKTWSKLVRDFEKPKLRKEHLDKAKTTLKYQDEMVEDLADNAEHVEFMGHKVLAVNSPVLQDQLGNVLATRKPPFAIVWRVNRGQLRVSLRSVDGFDISGYAKQFGGGGHPQSAGFTLGMNDPLPWKRLDHHGK